MDNPRLDPDADPPAAPDLSDREKGDGNLIAVGIGASAGGLEAFTELLRHLPPATGLAFIFVQHLDPHHQSALPEILAARTNMPVVQVQNETAIQADHVYVIPPNTLMLIRDRTLVLEARPPSAERFRPIDALFHSLAQAFRFNAVGVVLSGTASDGTLGLKSLKAEGGITFAQNQTAKFESMPQSAVAAGVVDFILSPRRIAEELAAIAQRTLLLNRADREFTGDGDTLNRLLVLLRRNTGVDFRQYKRPTILRRLKRRMVLRKAENLEQYCELLQTDSTESKALFDDLLIHVTGFFRDPEVFDSVKQIALPSLVRDRKQPYTIRVWIPGCSTGEEAYSIAILLVEFLESEDLESRIQIFGTDISDTAIERARAGIYDEGSVADVSPERLRRFFVRAQTGYQISRSIREMCIFSRHNVAKDPPLSRMDLVSCRNLLIYLAPSLQRRIVAALGYALHPNGVLVLGQSETPGSLSDCFLTLDERHKIYSRKPNVSQGVFTLTQAAEDDVSYAPAPPTGRVEAPAGSGQPQGDVDRMAVSRFGPAALVVDENLRIVEYRGEVAQYLVAGGTPFDADLMNAVRQELRSPLNKAIEQASRTNTTAIGEGNPPAGEPASAMVQITVMPLRPAGLGQHFLVRFAESGEGTDFDPGAQGAPPGALDQENARLREELKASREYLQSAIEELRSTNEEAQSANEELQSTNEELQTSKEELQSSNEELNTINAEMQSRNADLARVNDDLLNLLGSMNTPIVMAGSDLRVRRFTPTAEKVLRLIPTDVGRPIADLKPRINVPNLEEILQEVADTLQPYEREVQDQEGRLYLMRVRPYRTADHRIDGTVLQLLDVTELRRGLEEVKHARDYAEAIVNTVREPLVVLDQNLAIEKANRAFYTAVGLPQGATPGQTIYEIAAGRFDLPAVRRLFEQIESGAEQLTDIEVEYRSERGEPRLLSLNARRLQSAGRKQLILMAFEDITERKRAAEARYRRLFESARDGIVLVDADTGAILDLNPFAERLFGYPSNELVGHKLWETGPMGSVPRARAAFESIRDRGVVRFDDVHMTSKDGHDLQVELVANLYFEGERRAIQFNIRDVGERKRFERELQESQKLESLGLLAGGIAHDFNNLLTGIIGNASLAFGDLPANHPARVRLREVVRAGERAAFLTRQMLAYAGKGRFVTESIDVGDLIEEISSLVQTSIPKSVELKLLLAPNLPPVEADASQIQQVVMNLVINGAEAIGEDATGTVEIRTSLREIDALQAGELFGPEHSASGTYLEIEVTDTGSGMDEATKARIFDPFFTTKFTGRGLGLAAVQGIIKRHGGAIRVYSTPGHGTTFLVLLPVSGQTAAIPKEPLPVSIPAGSVALIIDDEEIIRSLARNTLSRAGMKVLAAANGQAGVAMFQEHHREISVAIVDLLMPVMRGDEVIRLLKRINPEVLVILSSGFDETEAARRFREPKPAGFLQKPYTAERLAEAVAAALRHRRT